MILVRMGHEIIGMAHNGNDAIKIYKEFDVKPDVVFMDNRMPGISGILAMEEIHKINESQIVYFISADDSVKKEVMEKGCKIFISKPLISISEEYFIEKFLGQLCILN